MTFKIWWKHFFELPLPSHVLLFDIAVNNGHIKSILLSFYIFFKIQVSFLKILLTYFQREGKGRRERNMEVWEKHLSVASLTSPTGDLAHNPGMCPDWELNQRPFGSQASAQSTEPHQPGLLLYFFLFVIKVFPLFFRTLEEATFFSHSSKDVFFLFVCLFCFVF